MRISGGGSFYGGYVDSGAGTFSSAATIIAAVAGGTLTLDGAAFTSSGTIAISNADTVTIGAAMFTNAGLISLGAGSTLNLNLHNYFASESFAAESFANTGSIALSGGSIVELTDGGTFPSVPLLNASGAALSGFGTLQSAIDNDGTITASGGALSIGQAVSGTGGLVVTAGATLSLSAIGTGQIASFSGVGGKLGLAPASFPRQDRRFCVGRYDRAAKHQCDGGLVLRHIAGGHAEQRRHADACDHLGPERFPHGDLGWPWRHADFVRDIVGQAGRADTGH